VVFLPPGTGEWLKKRKERGIVQGAELPPTRGDLKFKVLPVSRWHALCYFDAASAEEAGCRAGAEGSAIRGSANAQSELGGVAISSVNHHLKGTTRVARKRNLQIRQDLGHTHGSLQVPLY
jgi:hypothetical protein